MVDNQLEIKGAINPEIPADATNMVSLIAVNSLLSSENKKANSRIKYIQVSELAKLLLYADVFNISFVKQLVDNILDLQISINGLGRKEIVNLVNQSNNLENQLIRRKDIFR